MQPAPGIFQRLVGDLKPYPGRGNLVLRTVLACTIVVIVSQTLQIQWLALSLISVFFVSQTNVVVTRLTGMLFIVATTVAVALSLLLLQVAWNTPLLRIIVASLIFLISVFLMRTTAYGAVFFVVALVIIYSQSLVDISSDAETVVRNILWVWVSINYAIAVTLIVNSLLLPAEPTAQLKQVMLAQLDSIMQSLAPAEGAPRPDADIGQTGRDMQSLYRLLRYSVMRDSGYRRQESFHLARIATLSELRALAGQLPESMATPADRESADVIRNACRNMRDAIRSDSPDEARQALSVTTDNAVLKKMAGILNDYYHGEQEPRLPDEGKKASLLVPDALSNPLYRVFALKTLFSVLLCYLLYTATNWPGIHTIMLSCLIVAQPGLGNVQRKIALRLIGAVLGSLIALWAIVFILPHTDTLFGLLMLVVPVLAVSAWVSAGPESISYAGVQIMFTFSLAVLETFSPTHDLTEVRDRIVGIIAGIIIAGIVHTIISPEREGDVLLSRLAQLMSRVKNGLSAPAGQQNSYAPVMAELADCEALASRVALEPDWNGSEGAHDLVYQRMNGLLLGVRTIVRHSSRLALLSAQLPESARRDGDNVLEACGSKLDGVREWLLGKNDPQPDAEEIVIPQNLPQAFRQAVKELDGAVNHFYRLSETA